MLCRKNLIIGFGIFLPVFVSVLLSSSCYAISDFVFDIDSTDTFPLVLCGNPATNNYPSCMDYSYVKIEPVNNISGSLSANNSYFTIAGLYGTRVPNFTTSIFYLDTEISGLTMTSFPNNMSSVKVTFIDSLSSCNCPEVPECPPIPDNPYDEKLDNITMAIYCCGGILLVLYFFYCIYRLIIKSSGVDRL